MTHTKIFCAIDTDNLQNAIDLIKEIGPVTKGVKLGLEFFNHFGLKGLEAARESCPEADLFVDLKFHDIPNTVAGAVRAICSNIDPKFLNVHCAGGKAMMQAAKEACSPSTQLLGVTILTSLNQNDLEEVGYAYSPKDQVKKLAKLAQESGLDGVVCSAHEIESLRAACGNDFSLMVPGIRPAGSDQGDQKRVMTPAEAIQKGASHLVIGRPITKAENPAQAAHDILQTL